MQSIRAAILILVLGSVVMLLTGCSSSTETPTIVLTFDGNTCQYDGPTVVDEGQVNIVLKNKSDYELSLWATRLDEGKTWQDILSYIGTPGTPHEPPAWSDWTLSGTGSVPGNPDAQGYILKAGLYAINCCTCNEPEHKGVWPGAALEVQGK
jgi:hypothetical protein